MRNSDASEPTAAGTASYLTFVLGAEEYGVPLARVAEIAPDEGLTRVPGMPDLLRGILSVRGGPVAVVDLRRKFGLPPQVASRRESLVIVETEIDGGEDLMAIVVDRISRVTEIAAADIEPVPPLGSGIRAEFLHGMARLDRGFVLLLDVDRALTATEQEAITGALAVTDPADPTEAGGDSRPLAALPLTTAARRSSSREFVLAKTGDLRCAIDASQVQEVTLWAAVTVVPGSPPSFHGLFNLRGAVLPVFDLAAAMGQPPTKPRARSAFLVVGTPGDERGRAALAVEAVLGMTELARDAIQSLPEFACSAPRELVEGTALASGHPLVIVNLSAMLSGMSRAAS